MARRSSEVPDPVEVAPVEAVEAEAPAVIEEPAPAAAPEPVVSGDVERAAQKRADALRGRDGDAEYIQALLAERHGYVTRGLDDRVAQVDEQLALRGFKG